MGERMHRTQVYLPEALNHALDELAKQRGTTKAELCVDESSGQPLPNAHLAQLPPEKLRDYLLNPDHPVGRHKARLDQGAT